MSLQVLLCAEWLVTGVFRLCSGAEEDLDASDGVILREGGEGRERRSDNGRAQAPCVKIEAAVPTLAT